MLCERRPRLPRKLPFLNWSMSDALKSKYKHCEMAGWVPPQTSVKNLAPIYETKKKDSRGLKSWWDNAYARSRPNKKTSMIRL